MEFMYARLVDSAGLQEQQVFFHGHVITYSIYLIDVVPYTQVIHLNIPDWVENDDGPKIRQVLATYAVSSTTQQDIKPEKELTTSLSL